MNLTGPIESAELQFKQILEEFFIKAGPLLTTSIETDNSLLPA